MALQIEILTPSQTLMKGPADEVEAPSVIGEVGILPGHTDYITLLGPGVLRLKGSQGKEFNITGGLLKVEEGQKVSILVDSVS